VLLSQDAGAASPATSKGESSYGFYWTEGNRGIGWTEDGVPPIKIGSGLGIPSSPAIWDPGNHTIHKLDIRDVERLQGFDVDWTSPAEEITKAAARWKLVGNSVSVPLGAWVGECLIRPIDYDSKTDWPLIGETKWPSAAWGEAGKRFAANVSAYPVAKPLPRLRDFLLFQGEALSSRAAAGLLKRITNGTTRTSSEFLSDIKALAKAEVQRKYEQRLATLKNEIAAKTKELEQETVFGRKMTLAEEIKALKTTLAEEERSWDLESE
jgi:DNA (cytosine-5)-methyltransferase 1